jgi:hypothetical protein
MVNGGISEPVMCGEMEKQDGSFVISIDKPCEPFTGRLVLK